MSSRDPVVRRCTEQSPRYSSNRNQLMIVSHAYRDGSGVHAGQVCQTNGWDAAGRCILRQVAGTGQD
jgi:hypothetical protein